MADDTTASIIPLIQPGSKRRPKTDAERSKAYRVRVKAGQPVAGKRPVQAVPAVPAVVAKSAENSVAVALVPEQPVHTVRVPAVPLSRHAVTPALLSVAAIGLGLVGLTVNGWFARSLGSSEAAGWLFLAIGVAADLVALSMPSAAAMAWQARQRGAALAGWAIWSMTFVFAVTAGLGFAALNVTDVTASRAARVTPAVTAAQAALTDAMTARDRECKTGTGRFCRERESAVVERQAALDAAMRAVEQSADPQAAAITKLVTWLSAGQIKPTSDDFAMVRLLLLAMLPQLGGVLLMVSRAGSRGLRTKNA